MVFLVSTRGLLLLLYYSNPSCHQHDSVMINSRSSLPKRLSKKEGPSHAATTQGQPREEHRKSEVRLWIDVLQPLARIWSSNLLTEEKLSGLISSGWHGQHLPFKWPRRMTFLSHHETLLQWSGAFFCLGFGQTWDFLESFTLHFFVYIIRGLGLQVSSWVK